MPAGSKPGERRGGRQLGTPNKSTARNAIERAVEDEKAVAVVAQVVEEHTRAKASGQPKKLAKEVLEEFMLLFAGMAAFYQPTPPSHPQQNANANDDRFQRYAELACDAAHKLAKYQSPTFRAIVIAPPPPVRNEQQPKRFTLRVFDEHGKRVYDASSPAPASDPAQQAEDDDAAASTA